MNSTTSASPKVRVWDAPVRLFHWSMVCLTAFSWYSAEQGWMTLHLWSGSILFTLLVFRIAWGFVGSTTARFSDFVTEPRRVLEYLQSLRGNSKLGYAGHNPAGGWMVLVFIATLLAQIGTGLFANDGVDFHAPLALLVSSEWSDRLTQLHGYIFNGILFLVWLHLVAIFGYLLVRGENLIGPMVAGKKYRSDFLASPDLEFRHWSVALTALAVAAGLVGTIVLS